MPFGSVMTIPFDVNEEDQNRLRLIDTTVDVNGDDDTDPRDDSVLTKQRIIRLKCCQLVFTICIIVLFIYEKSIWRGGTVDLLIAAHFGALVMYPLVILSLPEYEKLSISMLVLNLISSLMMFTNGFFIFSSWYELQNYLIADAIRPADPMTNVALMKFLSATVSFITGIIYASEVFIQIIDNIRKLL